MISVQGVAINAIDRGSGPSVLFLHGNPDSAQVWESVMARMASEFRCVAIDLPGFGGSGPGDRLEISLENLAQFTNQVVDGLNLPEPVNLVVHDIGGPFGLAWVTRFPQRVGRLGILNTIFCSDYPWHTIARVWRTPLLGELSWSLFTQAAFVAVMQQQNPRLTKAQIMQTYRNITPDMQRMVLRFYRAMDPARFKGWEDELEMVLQEKPAVVLWGDRDPYIPARFADRFGAQQVQHRPDNGHWLMLEDPSWVAERLRRFFTEQATEPVR
ncbi:alpha/beta hydrolase [Nodosilinea sp. P-1105]|uniref:alpha/beta fold hydrolase n=1 Tax=Nodosilinea sp. P-1105 TaxID=2546229 RepID=UPI00146C936B|nr:alpha/beta hydrolase [Nodosilinea sp. P-1105]NMF85499.1 alpha/beta hydrolase [Nodosilinea sp. P-1105]